MKYQIPISLAILLSFLTCSKKPDTIAGHLLKSAQTSSHKNLCNPDSVLSSDCAGGDFYFTEKGNVLYSFFCPGEDSISYLIGKFFVADSLVTKCSFYQKYSLAVTQNKIGANNEFDADMNSGSLIKIDPVSIRLNKLKCEKFKYYFISNGRYTSNYLLSEPPEEYTEDYISKISKVKALSGL